MEEIKEKELKQITGGAFHFGLGFLVAAGVTFIVGIIDGYVRPLACRK